MKKLIETFTAVDENGKTYKIDYYQTCDTSSSLNSPNDYLRGFDEYVCGSSAVSHIGGDVFHIARLDTQVKKVR